MDFEKIIDDCLKFGNDGSAWNITNWDNARTYIREAIYASQREAVEHSVHPTPLTLFGMRVEIANWLKPGQWFIRPSRRG